jgi:hypothetical protein
MNSPLDRQPFVPDDESALHFFGSRHFFSFAARFAGEPNKRQDLKRSKNIFLNNNPIETTPAKSLLECQTRNRKMFLLQFIGNG